MKKILVLAAGMTLCAFQTQASSEKAWNQLFGKVNGTCIGQSGLDTPEATEPVLFDDATGKIAVLLRGARGGKSKGKPVELICLYDKKTGRASIAEYKWLGR